MTQACSHKFTLPFTNYKALKVERTAEMATRALYTPFLVTIIVYANSSNNFVSVGTTAEQ